MSNKYIKWLVLGNLLLTVGIIAVVVANYINTPKTAYVDLGKVFNGFKYKTIVETEYNAILNSRKRVLDSLEAAYISATNNNDIEKAGMLEQEYYIRQESFTNESNNISNEMTQKVWAQLTQYIMDYAEDNSYMYVFGTKGEGNLLYAKAEMDITDEVLKYANERYEGIN